MGGALTHCFGVRGGIPASHEGPHQIIGSVRVRMPGSVYAQVFYPGAETGAEGEERWPRHRYERKEAIAGLSYFLKQPKFLLANIVKMRHPYVLNAAVAGADAQGKLPVVFFSHGLAGNSSMYGNLCSDVASHGYVVVAFEHEDGSGSYALPEGSTEPLRFKAPPDDFEYTRDGVIEFRRPFIEKRTEEVRAALGFLERLGSGDADASEVKVYGGSDPARVAEVLGAADLSRLWLTGHSFGAAAVATLCAEAGMAAKIRGAVLLDLWAFPVRRDIESNGLPVPTLSVLSQEFVDGTETHITAALLEHTQPAHHSFYVPGTMHQQFSDMPFLLSKRLGKKGGSIGETPKELSQTAFITAFAGFLQQTSGDADAEHQGDWAAAAVKNTMLEFFTGPARDSAPSAASLS